MSSAKQIRRLLAAYQRQWKRGTIPNLAQCAHIDSIQYEIRAARTSTIINLYEVAERESNDFARKIYEQELIERSQED